MRARARDAPRHALRPATGCTSGNLVSPSMNVPTDHPLAAVLRRAAAGEFPPVDGVAEMLPPDTDGTHAVVCFTGHAFVLTDAAAAVDRAVRTRRVRRRARRRNCSSRSPAPTVRSVRSTWCWCVTGSAVASALVERARPRRSPAGRARPRAPSRRARARRRAWSGHHRRRPGRVARSCRSSSPTASTGAVPGRDLLAAALHEIAPASRCSPRSRPATRPRCEPSSRPASPPSAARC